MTTEHKMNSMFDAKCSVQRDEPERFGTVRHHCPPCLPLHGDSFLSVTDTEVRVEETCSKLGLVADGDTDAGSSSFQ
ncbi:hypothetical protein RUM44_011182 [Polyplax serrata]|uniref:Uncharacterized protein n=1 Tax=Polyplax serrata TaxID=468196 RepID=A0ABR1APA2_POLSC